MRRSNLSLWAFILIAAVSSQVAAFGGSGRSVRTVRLDGPTLGNIVQSKDSAGAVPWRHEREYCRPFVDRLKVYQESVVAQDKVMVDYFGLAAQNLRDWDLRLSPAEGQETFIRPGVFDPVRESADRAFGASQSVYEVSSTLDAEWVVIQNGIGSCLAHLDPEVREGLLARMADYNFNARENEVSVAGAIEVLASRMDEWHNKWGALEGKTLKIPEGYFSEISATADGVEEAKPLIEEMTLTSQSRLAELIEEVQASLELRTPVL